MRILHLVGSPTSEFFADLSRLYAADCLEATAEGHDAKIAYVSPGGRWSFPTDLSDAALAEAQGMTFANAVGLLVALDVQVMVPQMFCLAGMTTYRSLFDLLGIPYVGNRADVMAVAADKARTRAVVAAAGVSVPRGEVLRVGDVPTLEAPTVVKPVDADNSTGVTMVHAPREYPAALAAAFEHSAAVLVEDYVPLGREVRCGVLERDGELVCLPLEEYSVQSIRGEADKLARDDAGELTLVAKEVTKAWIVDVDDPVTAAVWDAARRCHTALGCRHYSLFDFRIDPDGRPWFLEAGLYCSFARKSVVSMMAAAAGITTPELFQLSLINATTPSP